MGLRHAVLGESAEAPTHAVEIARRVTQNHAVAGWAIASIEATIRDVKRLGLLHRRPDTAEPQFDPSTGADLTPLEVSAAGDEVLRAWRRRPSTPVPFRDHLLLKIDTSEEADLPELDDLVRERLEWVMETYAIVKSRSGPPSPRPELSWEEKRKVIARRLDLYVLDGMARGLRQMQSEVRGARARHDSTR